MNIEIYQQEQTYKNLDQNHEKQPENILVKLNVQETKKTLHYSVCRLLLYVLFKT